MDKNDFSKGAVWKNIVSLSIPMTIGQIVQLLYNIVDRIYIGHMDSASSLALTGLGLTFPIITIITAFTQLFGMGGTPLCSIARGMHRDDRAEKIIGNTFTMLICSSAVIMIICYIFMKDILYFFGASDATYPYAREYLLIYLMGTPFTMISTGMNGFINSQGFGKTGMATVMIGAVINIVLDPLFIFVFDMGIGGAAVATVISQIVSAVWVVIFLTGRKAILKIKWVCMRINLRLVGEITKMGMSGFIMAATNSVVQIVCNATLRTYGGDLYVGIMTILNSVRELFSMPINGITGGAQPVIGYNYGAGEYARVKQGIKFMSILGVAYTVLAWIIVFIIPETLIHMFNSEADIVYYGADALKIYFCGFFMMSLQFSGQSTFVALGQSGYSILFSLMRKVVIVVPLTLLLPRFIGVDGVFWAEPISNAIGGTASFVTMLFVTHRLLRDNRSRISDSHKLKGKGIL